MLQQKRKTTIRRNPRSDKGESCQGIVLLLRRQYLNETRILPALECKNENCLLVFIV